MVSTSKDLIKIIGDNTKNYVQGYFQYDSKKSGGVTRSHIRIGNTPIRSSYYVDNPNFIVSDGALYSKDKTALYAYFGGNKATSYTMPQTVTKVVDYDGSEYNAACFAMVCHHCGQRYVEFFPNAKQENLFIGIIHAFGYTGIPKYILTDNMKSVVLHRDFCGCHTGNPPLFVREGNNEVSLVVNDIDIVRT